MTSKPKAKSQELTALQSSILSTIHRYGPQSDVSLHAHSRCETLKAVIMASATLAEADFIERTPAHQIPQRYAVNSQAMQWWQLTQKGKDHIAALGAADDVASCNAAQQEVSLGSK